MQRRAATMRRRNTSVFMFFAAVAARMFCFVFDLFVLFHKLLIGIKWACSTARHLMSWFSVDLFARELIAWYSLLHMSITNVLPGWLDFSRRSNKRHLETKSEQMRDYLANLYNRFFVASGLSVEFNRGAKQIGRLPINLILLSRVHAKLHKDKKAYAKIRYSSTVDPAQIPPMSTALRMMKLATTIYGQDVVNAVKSRDPTKPLQFPSKRQSIVSVFLDYNPSIKSRHDIVHCHWQQGSSFDYCMNHVVLLDHVNRQAVLVIRGTSSRLDVLIDMKASAVPFCGGYAHWGYADMAKAVWAKAEYVLNDEGYIPKSYELVVTGHASGGSVASLLTVYVLKEAKLRTRRRVRCLAFAPAPSFYPINPSMEGILTNITAYTANDDAMTQFSMHGGRRLNAQIIAVNEFRKRLGFIDLAKCVLGWKPVPNALIQACVLAAQSVAPRRGIPPLQIVCSNVIWLNRSKEEDGEEFYGLICDPEQLRQRGMVLTPMAMSDHGAGQYQLALYVMAEQEAEEEEGRDNQNGTLMRRLSNWSRRSVLSAKQAAALVQMLFNELDEYDDESDGEERDDAATATPNFPPSSKED